MSDKKGDANITSHNQQGGITAQNVSIGAVGRRMDAGLQRQILNMIPKSQKVVISGALGDGESCAFAQEIFSFMKSEGYDVEGVNQSIWMPPVKGLALNNTTQPWEFNVGHHPNG